MAMRILTLLLTLSLVSLAYLGCEVHPQSEYHEQIVIQGQMTIGKSPIIRITHTVPITQTLFDDDIGVTGATVTMMADSMEVGMPEFVQAGRSGYYGDRFWYHVAAGVHYKLHVEANGQVLTAETVAAGPLHITYRSDDTVAYGGDELLLRWRPDTLAAGYMVLIDNMEDECCRQPVNGNANTFVGGSASNWSVSNLEDSLRVPWIILHYYGMHQVIIYSCDRAMWDYSYSAVYGQVENYPVTNVHGGLGLFSAGGVDTTYFDLVPDTVAQ